MTNAQQRAIADQLDIVIQDLVTLRMLCTRTGGFDEWPNFAGGPSVISSAMVDLMLEEMRKEGDL